VRRLADDGWTFRVAPPEEVAARMDELHAISDAWLGEKHTREKGFSLGFFSPDYLRRFPAALVEHHGTLAAFANVWRSAEHASCRSTSCATGPTRRTGSWTSCS
jgi:phosphatidylglycerol lysyltransferase